MTGPYSQLWYAHFQFSGAWRYISVLRFSRYRSPLPILTSFFGCLRFPCIFLWLDIVETEIHLRLFIEENLKYLGTKVTGVSGVLGAVRKQTIPGFDHHEGPLLLRHTLGLEYGSEFI